MHQTKEKQNFLQTIIPQAEKGKKSRQPVDKTLSAMSKSKLVLEQEVTVQSLFGNQIVPEEIVLAGMKDLENELNQTFKRAQEERKLINAQANILRDTLPKDEKRADVVKKLKEMIIKPGDISPKGRELFPDKQRIFTGSIGATVTPPFNYDWKWHASTGTLFTLNTAANKTTGNMSFDVRSADKCTCSARTAVGIYFRPMTSNGILRVSANPAINFRWADLCVTDSAHTDGFIGLYVGRYNLSGGFEGAAVSQQTSLWNDSSWWSGTSDSGSNSAFPLFAQFNVDSDHWYAMWVWCGTHIEAAGFSATWGSGAYGIMDVAVPSITWQLFG